MDNSRVKNIIIVILALLNALLIGTVAIDAAQSAAGRREASNAIRLVLESAGISVGDGVDLDLETPQAYAAVRNLDAESGYAEKVTGASQGVETGGGVYQFEGEDARAIFRGTGEIEVTLNPGVFTAGSDPASAASSFMKKIGAEIIDGLTQVTASGDGTEVTVTCGVNGSPVYNARVTLYFYGDDLEAVSGMRVFDTVNPVAEAEIMPLADAVVHFLAVMRENGYICSYLESVGIGYVMSRTVLGEAELTPVWYFDTDTVELYINARTGKMETIS